MRHSIVIQTCIFAFGALGCASGRGAVPPIDAVALSAVTSVYLGDFGSEDGASLIKERVRLGLAEGKPFKIVESASVADAILSGAVSIQKENANGEVNYSGSGILHLVQRATQKMIWAHEYRDRRWIAPPTETNRAAVAARVANQMVDDLSKSTENKHP